MQDSDPLGLEFNAPGLQGLEVAALTGEQKMELKVAEVKMIRLSLVVIRN